MFALVAVAAALSLAGCVTWFWQRETVMIVDESDNGKSFTLGPGDRFEVQLKENQTTPYKWSIVSYDHDVIIKVRDRYERDWAPPGTVGSGGTHVWRFEAVGIGTSPLVMVNHRIDEKPGRYRGQRFKITLQVDNHVD